MNELFTVLSQLPPDIVPCID